MIARTARDLGSVIKDARLRRGWTQADLADRIGVSRQWVIAFERGKPTSELGTALSALTALDLVADIEPSLIRHGGVDLDLLLDDHSGG